MEKKGISPIIAVILLTALAIAISMTVVTVFKGFVKEKCKLLNQACELLCDKVNLESSYSNGKLYISNLGNIPVYDVEIKIFNAGGYDTKSLLEISTGNWSDTGLVPGKVFSESLDIGDETQTLLTPILKGDNEITHRCGSRFEKGIN